MILRRPYKFLIKNFKIIHFILAIMYSYLAVKSYRVYEFINEYQAQGWSKGIFFDSEDYIDNSIYFVLFGSLIIIAIIVLLMRRKKKPITIYYSTIAFYLIGLVLFVLTSDLLKTMEYSNTLDTRMISIYKDVNLIFVLTQVVVIFLYLKRALGFDFKKFNFGQDLEELKADISDDEEVEIKLDIDTDNVIADIRKNSREFKYFYIENKFILNLLFVFVIFIASALVYININIYNKIYDEKENVSLIGFNMMVEESYKTKNNYKEEIITESGQSYLVVKFSIKNTTSVAKELDINKFNLVSNGLVYGPTKTNSSVFADLGNEYDGSVIDSGEEKEYIVTYLLSDNVFNNDLIFRYTDSLKFYLTKIEAKYKKVALSVTDLDNNLSFSKDFALGETLLFDDNILKQTKLTVESYNLAEKFYYNYEYCIRDDCRIYGDVIRADINSASYKALLALDLDLIFADNLNLKLIDSKYEFINRMSEIVYYLDGKEITNVYSLKDRTPANYTGENIYIEVPYDLLKADKIILRFNVRGQEYNYTIKENV